MSNATGRTDVDRYERELAIRFQVPHAVAVSSGTAALRLALVALGIGSGDEVLVPALAPASSVAPVLDVGARPVFVDCGPSGAGLDLEDLEAKITVLSKAVLLVHQWGRTGDACRTVEFAGTHGLRVIEDASQAIGTTIDGAPAGTLGDIGCFSTRAGNLLNSGEGGFLLTHDIEFAGACRTLRQHGQDPATATTTPALPGNSYRLADPLAAIARAKLADLDETLRDQARRTLLLTKHLLGTSGLVIPHATGPESWNGHSLLAHLDMPAPREFCAHLAVRGVPNSVGTYGLTSADQVPAFSAYVEQPCLRARAVVDTMLAISLPAKVTEDHVRQIATTVVNEARRWSPA
ncbi:DegT/DnrJ/EryC1/StrS family aminotransferase [Crossiella cryophila]|uniref:DegT/DnrJ/EryC1/StrS family aminotransferase n=1 Tax=Crossiella cryophila TaxID=43355 RepID=UPI001FE9FAAD|nr:aminotransferase class I/II-fold pyridoxal phosphate-dependent enzyme [Crossiella cryophila]